MLIFCVNPTPKAVPAAKQPSGSNIDVLPDTSLQLPLFTVEIYGLHVCDEPAAAVAER